MIVTRIATIAARVSPSTGKNTTVGIGSIVSKRSFASGGPSASAILKQMGMFTFAGITAYAATQVLSKQMDGEEEYDGDETVAGKSNYIWKSSHSII
jgi:hypothetical protein